MHWIDPDCLAPVTSKVSRFLFNPKGAADGLLLANGTEAHFPPHLSRKVLAAFQPGDEVTLYGVKPRGVDMIACVAIEDRAGARIVDTGPPPKAKKKRAGKAHHDSKKSDTQRVEIQDRIERQLHGPRGEIRGLLLESGAIARFPPHAAQGESALIKTGARIVLRGHALEVPGSRVIEVRAWGKSAANMTTLPDHPH